MSVDLQKIPTMILDELCSRFIINIPAEQRDDLVRVFFAVELAHWYFLDFCCEDDTDLQACHIKDFAEQIFRHCPFLRHYVDHLGNILSQWREYKFSVPTYGAILLDPTFDNMLLVRGFYNRESWGFPKGKVQENESSLKCAIREVMEEVGFDIKDRVAEEQYLERELNGQIIRLYIVKHVPSDTKFATKTKNEIKDIRWFPIADLPSHRRDLTPQVKLNITPKAFFMVIPFMKDLRRWINQERGISCSSNGDSDPTNDSNQLYSYPHGQQQQARRRAITYHGDTRSNIQLPTSLHHDMPPPEPLMSPAKTLQKQLSVQNTIQQHFFQLLKNDSLTVTDNTSITETLLMGGNNSVIINASHLLQLTPPMSNDEENKRPKSSQTGNKTPKASSTKEKKGPSLASTTPISPYRILPRVQTDGNSPSELNNYENIAAMKSRARQYGKDNKPFSNLTNDKSSVDQPFCFRGPLCWTQFRLNRSEVIRCLRE